MATFLANEINATDRDITGPTEQVQIKFPLKDENINLKPFFLERRWINNQRKSNSVWYNTPHWKIIALICCARRSPKVTLITVIVSIVAWKQARWPLLFITFFNFCLSCNINIPNFIGNLWWVLLLGNHLKCFYLHTSFSLWTSSLQWQNVFDVWLHWSLLWSTLLSCRSARSW